MIGRADAVLRKQVVKNQGRGETAEMTALLLGVGLERETRVELATLCLGSIGYFGVPPGTWRRKEKTLVSQ